jgi:hypothetical protein
MVNPPDIERMAKAHRGQLPTVRGSEEATTVVAWRWDGSGSPR